MIEIGEFLTRSTIWFSIIGYATGSIIFALSHRKAQSSRRRARWDAAARVVWTVACASLFAHFISAFQFYHGWSHAAAYEDTARQTEELFGLNWGGGLFINYALLIIWIVDMVWWWRSGLDSYRERPWPLVASWHGLLIFIIFNATVVFGDGIVRWLGLAICLMLALTWLWIVRRLRNEISTTSLDRIKSNLEARDLTTNSHERNDPRTYTKEHEQKEHEAEH